MGGECPPGDRDPLPQLGAGEQEDHGGRLQRLVHSLNAPPIPEAGSFITGGKCKDGGHTQARESVRTRIQLEPDIGGRNVLSKGRSWVHSLCTHVYSHSRKPGSGGAVESGH